MKVETLASQPGKIGVVAVQNQLRRRRITFVEAISFAARESASQRRIGYAAGESASQTAHRLRRPM